MLIRNLLARTRALASNAVRAMRSEPPGCLPIIVGVGLLLIVLALVL